MHLIKNTHTPGKHCSSTAIADLLNFHGFSWSEDLCFGLGGGLGITYLKNLTSSPTRLLHTRSLGYEKRLFNAIGISDFSWQSADSSKVSEAQLIAALKNDQPAMLVTDIFYLHYFNSSSHFPGHGIMVWGYDENKKVFYVSDTERENLEEVSFEDMRKARVSTVPPFICHGDFFAPKTLTKPDNLAVICQQAIVENAYRLLHSKDQSSGISALYSMLEDLSQWKTEDDWKWNCRFAYQTIEKRGTGGSGFRKMYARFLNESSDLLPSVKSLRLEDKMIQCAHSWFTLSEAFKKASEQEEPNFENVELCIKSVIAVETDYCNKAILLETKKVEY